MNKICTIKRDNLTRTTYRREKKNLPATLLTKDTMLIKKPRTGLPVRSYLKLAAVFECSQGRRVLCTLVVQPAQTL